MKGWGPWVLLLWQVLASPVIPPFSRCFRAFETQMTRLEAEFVRREAPPSYGQLIAQGLIPPVEDFPVYSASQVSSRVCNPTGFMLGLRGHPRLEGQGAGWA